MSRASPKRPLEEVGINGKVCGNCQRISFNGGTATDNRREMNDHIELGVIFRKEVTDIAPIFYVNAREVYSLDALAYDSYIKSEDYAVLLRDLLK